MIYELYIEMTSSNRKRDVIKIHSDFLSNLTRPLKTCFVGQKDLLPVIQQKNIFVIGGLAFLLFFSRENSLLS